MTISDPGLIDKIQGALDKLDDANEKLCAVFTDPTISELDKISITRALNHIAHAKQDASGTLPQRP